MTVLEGKSGASIRGSLFEMIVVLLEHLYLSFWRHGVKGGKGGWGGGGNSKIWQIAENCLHTVIPVWTHLAHLVVIWQQKRRGRGLSSQSGATYYPLLLLLLLLLSPGLVCKHTDVHPTLSPLSSLSLSLSLCRSWWCCVVMLGSCPIGAFLSSSLTLRLSVGCNWGVCKDECSTVTLQAAHSFKGESCSQSGNFKHSQ